MEGLRRRHPKCQIRAFAGPSEVSLAPRVNIAISELDSARLLMRKDLARPSQVSAQGNSGPFAAAMARPMEMPAPPPQREFQSITKGDVLQRKRRHVVESRGFNAPMDRSVRMTRAIAAIRITGAPIAPESVRATRPDSQIRKHRWTEWTRFGSSMNGKRNLPHVEEYYPAVRWHR